MSGAEPPLPFKADRLRTGRRVGVRHVLDALSWDSLAADPPPPGAAPLLGLWSDAGIVNALFHEGRRRPVVVSVAAEGLRYRGLSGTLPAAIPFERRIRDLDGLEAMFAADLRPVLDHGAWSTETPLARTPGPPPRAPMPIEWVEPADTDRGLAFHEEGPFGGVLPGLRCRVALAGPAIRRLEIHGGYRHRGLAASCAGRTPAAAAAIIGRIDATSGVAHALAFSRAAEQALGLVPPPAALLVRVIASEAEHVVASLASLARSAAAADDGLLASVASRRVAVWRDATLTAFGHRFAAGVVVPGGVAAVPRADGLSALAGAAARLASDTGVLHRLFLRAGGLSRALGSAGRVRAADVLALSAGGPVARAAGVGFDARAGEPFAALPPVTEDGTASARVLLLFDGLARSGARIGQAIAALPPDGEALAAEPPPVGSAREGIGVAEAPFGDVWHVVAIDGDGLVASLFVRDPAMAHAALLERAAVGLPHALLGAVAPGFGVGAEAIDQ